MTPSVAPRSPRRPLALVTTTVLALVLAVLLARPAPADASTLALRVGSQPPVAGQPFTVVAEGVAVNNGDFYTSNLTATIKPATAGAVCGPDLYTDTGSLVMIAYAIANGPYSVPLPVTVDQPGVWLACVWLDSVTLTDNHEGASLLVTVAAAPAPPATGEVSTLALRLAAPALEDRPFRVLAEGVAVNSREWDSSNLTAKVQELRAGASCGPDFHTTIGSTVSLAYAVASGQYRVPLPVTIDRPGRYLVCAWLDSVNLASSHTSASLVVTVRGPKHRLSLAAPTRTRTGATVVRIRGRSELPRLLLTRVLRGRASCGQAYAAAADFPVLVGVRPVRGAIGLDVRTLQLRRAGTYTLCAYLQEEVDEPRAERIARRVVRVR